MKRYPPQKVQSNQADGIIPGRRKIAVYLGRCWSVITDAAVLLAVTIVGYIAILFICKTLWHLYISTATGQTFINYFPEEAASTSRFLQMDLVHLSIWITLYSFMISIMVGSLCRLLYVARYIHEQFGFLGRTFFCGLPLTCLVASYVQPLYQFPAWDTTFMVVLIPTLSVFNRCFNYSSKLLPELGDLKKQIK